MRKLNVEKSIQTIRGQRVLLDEDLATLYGVPTKVFNQAVKRHESRFPEDFRFQLTSEEAANLRSQSVTSSGHGGRRYLPYVFTQEGVAMLSSVLDSPRAIAMNIEIMRAFVRMRQALIANAEMMRRLGLIEAEVKRTAAELGQHKSETTQTLKVVFEALRKLAASGINEPEPPREPIRFKTT